MNDPSVPVIVITVREDDVEFINRTLRDAGHAVHCLWVQDVDVLHEALNLNDAELMLFFIDDFPADVRAVAKVRQNAAQMVPLVVISKVADESAITDAMQAGAQDMVSTGQRQRLCAVAERELRSFRLERALNNTLTSATAYKKQLKAFMAGSVDAIAYAQEGIVVEANQAWAELFMHKNAEDANGPLMDRFDSDSQAALKGALIACAKRHWDGQPLKATGLTSRGATLALQLSLEIAQFDGEPAVKLSVVRESAAPTKEPQELVNHAVHTDAATGFYHRRRFVELLTDKLDTPVQGGVRALAYIRPDKFRDIEDEFGPLASEEIIVQFADVLRSLAHKRDLCGRFGDNVFTVVVERGTLRDIEAWAENAATRISDHMFEVARHTLSMSCTIGLAEIGRGTDRVEDLIKSAELATQRGRQRGGNQVVLEETADESTRIERFDKLWVHQIRSALVDNRFRLVHLPIASLGGEQTKIFDTVLRLVDQQGDEQAATEFMGAATRNSLLRPIDRWVIGATMQCCMQQQLDLVFVKLSHESIMDNTLVDWVLQQLETTGTKPVQICFQVSEADATQYLRQTNAIAEKLKDAGFYFALEHFGIGRDPLRVLGQTAVNYVKIDGSLMQSIATDVGLQEKVRGFVRAAEKRKILTIAERVEDANTMAVLFQLGIGFMQGHYLHEPEVILEEKINVGR